jgi:dihydropteroate synthase
MAHPDPIELMSSTLSFDGPPLIMGIINCTPDSFSDGGDHLSADIAVKSAMAMVRAGASILDVGGESTRPGSKPVSLDSELERVIPVIREIRLRDKVTAISVDTTKAAVADAAIIAGADIVNDVSGMTHDPDMTAVVAGHGAAAVLMHMRGSPKTMQSNTVYTDIVDEIRRRLDALVERSVAAGVDEKKLVVDPGIGFGKDVAGNLSLLRYINRFSAGGRPVFMGSSRKSFIGQVLQIADPREREWGTAGAVAAAVCFGAHILRVHEVGPMWQVSRIAHAISAAG